MKLSFIIGLRDRGAERLMKSLESLRAQSCCDYEVIVIDYGSSKSCSPLIEEVTSSFSFCRYIYSDTRGWVWNRSAALNIGLREARGDIVFLSDVDIIYPRWFIEEVLKRQDGNRVFSALCYRCPEGFYDWDGLARNPTVPSGWSEMQGRGLLCCPRDVLCEIGGLDEQYGYWGCEDHDLWMRLGRSKLKEDTRDAVYCFHQWHPRANVGIPLSVQFANWSRYTKGLVGTRKIANKEGPWGQCYKKQEREIYTVLDPDSGMVDGACAASISAGQAASKLSITKLMDSLISSDRKLWALPLCPESGTVLKTVNRVLRRLGYQIDVKKDYSADFVGGLLLTVPEMFRDYYFGADLKGRPCLLIMLK